MDGGSARRKAATFKVEHKHRKTQPFMPRVGFEPTIPVFEGARTFRALERAAAVIGLLKLIYCATCPVQGERCSPQHKHSGFDNVCLARAITHLGYGVVIEYWLAGQNGRNSEKRPIQRVT
jgi:hypothetical protein